METFASLCGPLHLDRVPAQTQKPLRAWDSADELLLAHSHENVANQGNYSILVVNDQFGALATTLSQYDTITLSSWSDSYISQLATLHNLKINACSHDIKFIPSIEEPTESYDFILIKIPKVTALLEWQLNGLASKLKENGRIIAAGMCKHMPKSVYTIFEKHIGTTSTSLAKKKARLIFVQNEITHTLKLPYPKKFIDADFDLQLSNHANVFSKEKLDIGARFFLEHFKQLPQATTIIDLGCGNGVLGLYAHRLKPQSHIHFVDESFMAIESAKDNFEQAFGEEDTNVSYTMSDCLQQVDSQDVDLILCNPPFHQQHSTGDLIAWRMFQQSYNKLRPLGELWVIANRHLGYHIKLQRLFSNCVTIDSNGKFVILRAIKAP